MRIEVLRADHLKKAVGDDLLLRDINLQVFQGSFHAVLMQNQSISQSLVGVLGGEVLYDSGQLYLGDTLVTSRDALTRQKEDGLFVIGKESFLIPSMSVAENLFLTDTRYYQHGFVNSRLMRHVAERLLWESGLSHIDPLKPAALLREGDAHIIEIMAAVAAGARILLLDNVSEQYSERDMKRLIQFLRILMKSSVTVLFFEHKYNQFFDEADYATLIHDGVTVMTLPRSSYNRRVLLRYLRVGDSVSSPQNAIAPKRSRPLFEMSVGACGTLPCPLELSVRPGEVVSVCDVNWDSIASLTDILLGRQGFEGRLFLDGREVRIKSPRSAISHGIAYVQGSNISSQIFNKMSLEDNVTLMMRSPLYRFCIRDDDVRAFVTAHLLDMLGCGDLWRETKHLDGMPSLGKHLQFHIVLSRWLCCRPKLLILENPFLSFNDATMSQLGYTLQILRQHGFGILILSMNYHESVLVSDRLFLLSDRLREVELPD